jgi:transposase
MGKANFSDDFKRDAVLQITERGYPIAEVSKLLGVSPHSLYAWKKKFSKPSGSGDGDQAAEIRRLKKELARVTEERDILKRGEPLQTRISPRMQSEIRARRRALSAVFGAYDVSLPAHPSERFLRLAQASAEQAGGGRRPPDRAYPAGMEGQRQGVWLSQIA